MKKEFQRIYSSLCDECKKKTTAVVLERRLVTSRDPKTTGDLIFERLCNSCKSKVKDALHVGVNSQHEP
jgi:type II secretory ATPase GspE/PulE/Tfp pilus assembly ATPase PilB-like protein